MKLTLWLVVVTATLVFATEGCKKAQTQTATQDRFGIGVDWPKLDTEFHDSEPAVRAAVASIKRSILYHQFPNAIADLQRLSSNSTLTDAQKKILNDLRDQTRQVMASASSSPAAQ